jgi:serine/threonine protein kinase
MNVTDSVVQIVPVKAYFMVPSNAAEWHLVTPYLPGGNLNNLANKIKEQHRYGDIREIDAAFRPSFHKFLRTLEWLHGRGFCHDDVKLANIFIDEDGNWVLGDLGNIRHVNHPYHSSRIWLQDNKQLADCRANDAFRALKTYLQFLRRATNDGISFDVEFFKRKHGFSRLYWRAITDSASMSAAGIRGLSETLDPRQLPYDRARETPVLGLGRRRALSNAVNEALRTMLSERTARLAALTWIFGVPVGEC